MVDLNQIEAQSNGRSIKRDGTVQDLQDVEICEGFELDSSLRILLVGLE